MSAWRNVAYGIAAAQRPSDAAARVELLERFGVGALADARPARSRAASASGSRWPGRWRADPRALLLDEPLSALDAATRRPRCGSSTPLLAELDDPDVLVTHSFDEAALLGDAIAVLDRGRIVQSGTAAEISAQPALRLRRRLHRRRRAPRRGASAEADGLTLVQLDGGGEVRSVDARLRAGRGQRLPLGDLA